MKDPIKKRYLESEYFDQNPEWDIEDSSWKAEFVTNILKKNKIVVGSVCDVGSGAHFR